MGGMRHRRLAARRACRMAGLPHSQQVRLGGRSAAALQGLACTWRTHLRRQLPGSLGSALVASQAGGSQGAAGAAGVLAGGQVVSVAELQAADGTTAADAIQHSQGGKAAAGGWVDVVPKVHLHRRGEAELGSRLCGAAACSGIWNGGTGSSKGPGRMPAPQSRRPMLRCAGARGMHACIDSPRGTPAAHPSPPPAPGRRCAGRAWPPCARRRW